MLVITRKANELIRIGEHIQIKVISISGNRVKLGIQAPPHVSVVRDEIAEQREQQTISIQDYIDRREKIPA